MVMPRSTPAAQGVDGRGLLALLDAAETPGHGYHSLMIARHGHVIAEGWWAPYARDRVHLGYSLSKSFTATVLGSLVGRGLIDLDAPVLSYLTELRLVPPAWRRVTVRDCVTMTVGHTTDIWDWRGDAAPAPQQPDEPDPLLPLILEREPDGEPGQVWAYNQVGPYLVAQAIAAVTGQPLSAHLRRELLDPFGGADARAQRTLGGRDLGFSGLCVTTPAILALAQTWLDGGVWQGRRIVPAEFAEQAPRPTSASLASDDVGDWSHGYGYSFWRSSHGYRGDGAFGQFALVLPEQDVAVAITSETEAMQDVLDQVWRHLLPAIDTQPDPQADVQLARRLAGLEHPPLSGSTRRSAAPALRDPASQLPATYRSAALEVSTDGHHRLRIDHPAAELVTEIGDGCWLESRWPTPSGPDLALAASGAWRDGVFVAQLRLVETPHTILLELDPASGTALLNWRLIPLTGPDPLQAAAFPI
ncbi:MAG: serine hydrolase domain-containing protein [Propionicimonas sp.]|uniref:serine hydrolase domain-containing protein n=1 Tax=Propionicimonas sp. TaxID=1955623 RepID=UPI002B200650|nr:serine hydrolase domain-containing protein [Propionicimonas sp.]MEA4944816.1 serine hydrolase domain-containing protein [Propionicimonas sp.]MEA5051828.1 serine hydrolase domain-containing protein [Propionicimonas sp.]